MAYLEELLPEFRKGAKIRRKDWDDGVYLVFDTKDELIIDKEGGLHNFIHSDIISDEWELYQEPIDWGYIIKNKCLCWFGHETEDYVGFLEEIDHNSIHKFIMKGNVGFRNCRPVRRDEVTFYEDKKDE